MVKTQEWHDVDKSHLSQGEWTKELDKKQWLDKETGLACLIVRSPGSYGLCGYVGVSEGHPWFKTGYSQCPLGDKCTDSDDFFCNHRPDAIIDIHGGLTFSDACDDGGRICHIQEEGDPEVKWFGFDCAHSGDYSPSSSILKNPDGTEMFSIRLEWETYKPVAFVEEQCKLLAKQLKEVA